VIAVMGSVVLFALSILFLSRPIFKSVEIANQLGKRNYQVDIHHMSGKNEIAVLNNALYKLKQDLIELETENKHFMEGLADRIKTITQDIEQKNKLNQLLLGVSRLFLEKGEEQDLQSVILETFFQISQGLELQYIGIFQIQESRLTCQYNPGDGPLKSAANQPFDPLELSNLLTSVSSLTVFTKEQGAQNPILSRFFAKLPESKTIYLQAFSEGGGPQELLMLVSESMPDRRHWGELENMLKVYLSLYTNFRKGRQFAGELKELNKTLEAKVLEKTRINLEISNSLIAQDKLVTIGELSAGVAHDLNTPLGSIKAAAQNLKLIVLDLLPRLNELDTQDLNFAIHFARTYPEQSALLNSSEKMKRAEGLREAISRHSQRTDLLELSKLFAEAGFNPQQDKEISEVLAKVDPIAILKAIKDLHLVDAFLTGIESSVDRSSQVITNLNRFVREDLTQKKELIDLSNSIRIVETLFRFRLRGHIDLITEIQPGSTIMGVEMKLFQVWTNIVKNAIDAFEEQTENANKYIKIFTEVNPEQVIIHFENNGPRIPEDEVQRIFRKFYTTKQKRNGTGLGLSIVSNILAEHYGKISVQSDDQKTTFSIGFPRAEA